MNILPKKRWHVRTKDNIARVRKDEAAAREEDCKRQYKLELAESEVRVNFLRKRSGLPEKKQHKEKSSERPENEDASNSQHVNLFADYKVHVKTTNKELEKEKKEEQEKYEKKIGYLTYLGQDTNEALRLKSWYEVAPKRCAVGSERGKINEKDIRTKHNHDPLTLINALLPPDPKPITIKRKRNSCSQTAIYQSEHPKSSKKDKKEHKKEKYKKHSKERKHKEKKTIEEKTQKRLKLEQLRKERIRRETAEKARQEALLAPKLSNKVAEVTKNATPRVIQKYNSQFNPEYAKQNMN